MNECYSQYTKCTNGFHCASRTRKVHIYEGHNQIKNAQRHSYNLTSFQRQQPVQLHERKAQEVWMWERRMKISQLSLTEAQRNPQRFQTVIDTIFLLCNCDQNFPFLIAVISVGIYRQEPLNVQPWLSINYFFNQERKSYCRSERDLCGEARRVSITVSKLNSRG